MASKAVISSLMDGCEDSCECLNLTRCLDDGGEVGAGGGEAEEAEAIAGLHLLEFSVKLRK